LFNTIALLSALIIFPASASWAGELSPDGKSDASNHAGEKEGTKKDPGTTVGADAGSNTNVGETKGHHANTGNHRFSCGGRKSRQ
jgi:hypothetical protein